MEITKKIEDCIAYTIQKLSNQQIYGFITALIAGLLAHGYILFNRISYHDNSACLFNLGGTYESGRWMLGFIYDIQMKTTKLFSVPVFNGGLSILLIAITAMVLIELFDVKSKLVAGMIGAVMVVYPVVTSIFSFMFTSWEYMVALLLSVLAAKALIDNYNVKGFIISAILGTLGLGIYQAFLAVTIALFLINLYLEVIADKINSPAAYIKKGVVYLINLVVSLGLWAIIRKLTMAVKGITAVDYKGMNEGYSVSEFPNLMIDLFKAFFGFGQAGINAVLYQRAFTALIFVVTVVQILLLLSKCKNSTATKLVSIIGLVILPIGMNVVYLLSTSSAYKVDSLMVYGDIFVYILPLILLEKISDTEGDSSFISKAEYWLSFLQIICVTIMTLGYVYMDNAAYMKAEIAQEQAVAYFNQMVTAIKTCDGFEEDMEIVLVGWENLEDATFVKVDNVDQLDAIKLDKFPRYTDLVQYAGSIHFIREHIGFGNENVIVDEGEVAAEEAVKSMPTYPNDGSIAVVDGRVIVKLGD